PQLAGGETHGIEMFTTPFTAAVGIGEHVATVVRRYDAAPAAHVARRTGVAEGMAVHHAHCVAGCERRFVGSRHVHGAAGGEAGGDLLRPDDAGGEIRARALPGNAVGEFLGAHEALLHEQCGQAGQPVLVVTVAKVLDGVLTLASVAGLVEVPLAEEPRGKGQRERAPLPLVMEYRLVALVLG